MTNDSELEALADEQYVSLTTFRKTGVAVSTPVWIARDGDALVVTTLEASGKVKRLRNRAQVELRPCDRMGKVKDGAATVSAVAEIVTGAGVAERLNIIFRGKYKLQYRMIMLIERLRKQGRQNRVMLRITSA